VGLSHGRVLPNRAKPGRAAGRPAGSEHEERAEKLKPARHQPYYTIRIDDGFESDRLHLLGLRDRHAGDQVQDRVPALWLHPRLLRPLTIPDRPASQARRGP